MSDLAIDGGGFLILEEEGRVELLYTRFGNLSLDARGRFADSEGRLLLGFDPNASDPETDPLIAIDLSDRPLPPKGTTLIEVNVNLDPSDVALSGGASGFNHTKSVNTSNFQTGIRIFDSLGNPTNILVYFRKNDAAANSWFYYAGMDRNDVNLAAFDVPYSTFATVVGHQGDFFPMQSGTLTFSTQGALITESTAALSIDYDANGDGTISGAEVGAPLATPANAPGWAFAGGAASGQAITFDFGTTPTEGGSGTDKTTQFGGVSASGVNNFVRFLNQNGFPAGSLASISISAFGEIFGAFTNFQVRSLARIALVRFLGETHLERTGEFEFIETAESGPPIFGFPNEGGFGAVRSGFLEILEDSPLDLCLAGERLEPDLDGDGEISGDRCPNTPPSTEVDSEGCSLEQFCARIDVQLRGETRTCRRSDWKNDEARAARPRDCQVIRLLRGEPVACVPR